MTKIDIFSGFLGAGKTTLIKKLIKEAYAGEKLVLIENEFGEIGIDGGFLQDAGINITEMNSGCICCSLVGDFGKALQKVLDEYAPDRILIEPSGVGKLSDVVRAVESIHAENAVLNATITVVDAGKCKMYMKNFGEFFNDQVTHAGTVILSHTARLSEDAVQKAVALVREHNADAAIVTTDWDVLDGKQILAAMEKANALSDELKALESEAAHHHHHHGEEECDDEECECHHHHHHDDDDEDEHHHHHHHHHHGEDECDEEECECHHHHHGKGHHHHHHADDVFTSFGVETTKKFSAEELNTAFEAIQSCEDVYGTVLRAKGIVENLDGGWLHFDYVPGEVDIRSGAAAVMGRLCVIGAKLDGEALSALFGVNFVDSHA